MSRMLSQLCQREKFRQACPIITIFQSMYSVQCILYICMCKCQVVYDR